MNIRQKVGAALVLVFLVVPAVSFAQTMSVTQLQAEIANLTAQLQALRAQLAASTAAATIITPATAENASVSVSASASASVSASTMASSRSVIFSPGEPDIAQVVSNSPTGTTFTFLPGVYNNLSITAKTGDRFIGALGSDGSRQTIFSGAQTLSGFTQYASGIWMATTTQTTPGQVHGECNAASKANPYPSCMYDEDLFYDGQPYVNVTAGGNPANLSPGQYYFDYSHGTIYVMPLTHGDNPNTHQVIYNRTRGAVGGTTIYIPCAPIFGATCPTSTSTVPYNAVDNVDIENIVVQHYAIPDQMAALGGQWPGNNWMIKNVEVAWNHGAGVNLGGGSTLENSYIHDNGEKGVGAGGGNIVVADRAGDKAATNITILGNIISHNIDYNGTSCNWECGGMKFTATTNLVIENNTISDNVGPGSWNDVYSVNTTITGNTFANNTGPGAMYEISSGATITGNTFTSNGACDSSNPSCSNVFISNSQNVNVSSNTITVANGGGWAVSLLYANRPAPAGSSANGQELTQNDSVYNNDITFFGTQGQVGVVANYATSTFYQIVNPTNQFYANRYHAPIASAAYWANNGQHYVLDNFQKLGYEKGSTLNATDASIPSPTASISASPASLTQGNTTVITWSSTNAASCTASGGWIGSKSIFGGTYNTGALATTTAYNLSCANSAGITVATSVTVMVTAKPAAAIIGGLNLTYESCGPIWGKGGESCSNRTADMNAAGFNAAINYDDKSAGAPGSANSLGAYIDASYANGVKQIIQLSDLTGITNNSAYPAVTFSELKSDPIDYPWFTTCVNLATKAACANMDDVIKYVTSLTMMHAGTWGYYVGDEPATNGDTCTGDVPAINKAIADIRTQDTTHPIMIVLGWWNAKSQADMTAQVGCFNDPSKNLVVGIDYYPFSKKEQLSANYPNWEAGAVTANASKGVVGGVEIGDGFSSPNNGVWPGLMNMESQKADYNNAHIPNGSYGIFSWYNIVSAPTNSDPTPVSTKESNVTAVLAYSSMKAPTIVPASTVFISALPTSLTLGSSTMITWSSTNAASCSVSGSGLSSVATSGAQSITPTATGTLSYGITCKNAANVSVAASTSITVAAKKVVTTTVPAHCSNTSPSCQTQTACQTKNYCSGPYNTDSYGNACTSNDCSLLRPNGCSTVENTATWVTGCNGTWVPTTTVVTAMNTPSPLIENQTAIITQSLQDLFGKLGNLLKSL